MICILEDYRDVLSICDLSKILNVCEKTAISYIKKGYITGKKIGRKYYVSKASLIQFIENDINS